MNIKNILVIAAHPDDEILGVGGVIAKHVSEGDSVFICILSEGATARYSSENVTTLKEYATHASEILGVEKLYFSSMPDQKLDTLPLLEVTQKIEQYIRDINPHIIYTHHSGDINKDHRIVFDATMVAARPTPDNRVKKIYCYETPSSTEWGPSSIKPFKPNVYVDIEKFIDIKLKAMEAYISELRNYPHPRSIEALRIISQYRGIEVGLRNAEAFMLMRELR